MKREYEMKNTLRRKVNKSTDRISMLFILYALFTIIIYTMPMLKITLPYMAVAAVLLVSIFFFMYMSAKWMYFAIVLCIASLILAALNLLTGAYGLVDSINEMIRNIRFFLPILWGCYALKNCTEKQRKFVLLIFAVMCGYILLKTFDALQTVPDVCRELAKSTSRDSVSRTTYRMQNVGGFEYSYMMGIVTLGFVWNTVKANNKKIRIISAVAAVVCYYFIIQTMYTLLLILTFVGTVLIFFFATKSKIVKTILIAGSVAVFIFMEPLFKALADLFSFNFGLEEKFTSMYLAIHYDDVDMVGSRPELLLKAFLNWTKNPIFGGRHTDSNSHSFLMTYLENTGIIGLGVWIGFFAKGWQMIRSELSKYTSEFSFFDTAMIYVLILAFFNPIGYVYEVLFAVFFIVPIWNSFIVEGNNSSSKKVVL